MPIKFLVLGGGGGLLGFFTGRGWGWKSHFYFYGRGGFWCDFFDFLRAASLQKCGVIIFSVLLLKYW